MKSRYQLIEKELKDETIQVPGTPHIVVQLVKQFDVKCNLGARLIPSAWRIPMPRVKGRAVRGVVLSN